MPKGKKKPLGPLASCLGNIDHVGRTESILVKDKHGLPVSTTKTILGKKYVIDYSRFNLEIRNVVGVLEKIEGEGNEMMHVFRPLLRKIKYDDLMKEIEQMNE